MKTYANGPVRAQCPICDSDAAQMLWDVSSKGAAQHYVLKEADEARFGNLVNAIESLWKKNEARVVRCGNCEFVYSDPYVAGDGNFYGLAYQRTGYPKWKWEYQVTLDALRNVKPGFQYLEIGAGDGAFVSRIVPEMTRAENAYCTEFSDFGRERIRGLGIRCESTDIRDANRPDLQGRFDVVCMFQVLEHLDGLDSLFSHLRWLTADDAHLFIAVPNPDRIEFNELHGAMLDMPPNHIGRYRRTTFDALCRRWGWEAVACKVEKGSFAAASKSFVLYRFLKNAQRRNSLENRIMRIRQPKVRKALQLAGVALNVPAALPALASMSEEHRGMSLWVHLRKMAL
jgi:SAM-dependent methyltransferase